MQLCTSTQAFDHYPTAAQCQAYALTRLGEADGVQAQLDSGTLTAESTGACVYSTSNPQWLLVSTTTIGAICDDVSLGRCACVPVDEYITIEGETLTGHSPIQIGFDTVDYPGHPDHNAVYTAGLCCQLCAQTQAPYAPPSPPFGPSPPGSPPCPPGVPPPPPVPALPPGTLLASAATGSFAPFNPSTNCRGLVITDDGYCHLYNTNTPRTHSGAGGCTSSSCSNVLGRIVYTYPSPPPPPFLPQSSVCRAFTPFHDERVLDHYEIGTSPTYAEDT